MTREDITPGYYLYNEGGGYALLEADIGRNGDVLEVNHGREWVGAMKDETIEKLLYKIDICRILQETEQELKQND